MSHFAEEPIAQPEQPTQVKHPWRTTARSVAWLVIALAIAAPTAWKIVQDEAAKAHLSVPGASTVTAICVWITVMVAAVQRIVLIPGVAAVIAKIPFLSATPKE